MKRHLSLALVCALAALPTPALASGAWSTFSHPYRYTDLESRGDTLWCATLEAGLLRFDRTTGAFASITREPGALAGNQLTSLAYDRSGRLWVGTLGQGLSRLSADGSRWDLINTLDGLPTGVINVIEAQGDTLWIGTSAGVALWNGREIAGALPAGSDPSPFGATDITGIAVRGDSLWVSNTDGAWYSRVSDGLRDWTQVIAGLPDPPVVIGLAAGPDGMFALSSGAPFQFNPASGQWEPRGGFGFVSRLSDDGGVILAMSDQGLYRWTSSGWQVANAALISPGSCAEAAPCPDLFAATVDAAGLLIAANQNGVWQESAGGGAWSSSVPQSIVGNNIQNLALDGSRVYVATYIEGVGRYDGTTWRNWPPVICGGTGCDTTFRYSGYAFMLDVDRQGRKWVGNWDSAIEAFDDPAGAPPSFTHFRFEGPTADTLSVRKHTFAWSMATDDSGGHWLGMDTNGLEDDPTPIGIEYYDASIPPVYRANYRAQNTPAMDNVYVRALWFDKRGRLWVGYKTNGLDVFKKPTPGLPLEQLAELPSTATQDIFGVVGYGDSIWVMSSDALRRFDAGSQIFDLSTFYALPGGVSTNNALHPIDVGPDGSVWIGTSVGVSVYHPNVLLPDNFTIANSPLADNDVRAIRVDPVTGVVWIGTGGGLNRFDPHYVPPTPPTPERLRATIYPNPSVLTALGVSLRIAGNSARYVGEIYDISGRRLRRFDVANGAPLWDGRTSDGELVPPGVYLARIEAGGRSMTARLALLR
jgi:Two component regulator propeller